jgi:2-polyprenyl-6-methoxyphenol hydroxylase-like FAD-dependent oxidoreductase
MTHDRPYGHAVVAGGSLAGLLAAHSLAKHFSRVTLLERDRLPENSVAHRRGVPQSRHLHILLGLGRQTMERIMPGLTADLLADGAVATDVLGGIRYVFEGHRAKQAHMDVPAVLAGRTLIESRIRERVRQNENVFFHDGREVTGLALDDSTGRVAGVYAVPVDAPTRQTLLEADLVVDATGRGARGAAWLKGVGLDIPDEDEANIRIAYTTRHFRRRPGDLGDDRAVIITPTAENLRGGTMNAQENDTWIVTLFGYLGEEPPVDLDGFKEFAGALAAKDIEDVLQNAEPLDEGTLIRFPASRRRRFETLKTLPDGYIALGDALCSFNPVYGQGMTIAALESDVLDICLRNREGSPLYDGSGLTEDFYAQITPAVDLAWATAVGADLKYPEVEVFRAPEVEQINAFMSQMYLAASQDKEVSQSLVRLINLLAGPEALQDPEFIERVQNAAAQAG